MIPDFKKVRRISRIPYADLSCDPQQLFVSLSVCSMAVTSPFDPIVYEWKS